MGRWVQVEENVAEADSTLASMLHHLLGLMDHALELLTSSSQRWTSRQWPQPLCAAVLTSNIHIALQ
jgi:hypothetical protein